MAVSDRLKTRFLLLGGMVAAAGCLLPAAAAHAATVLIDFGAAATQTSTVGGKTWTNITDANDLSGSPHTLTAIDGVDSTYRMVIDNPTGTTDAVGFNGTNPNGATSLTSTAAARDYPASATRDSLYGNTVSFNGNVVQSVRLTLRNLSPLETYSFDFFASRTGVADNRETQFAVTGLDGTQTVLLDAANNTGNMVGVSAIRPNVNNEIVILLSPGSNNNNTNRFFYLNVLEINSVPEPATAGLLAIAAAGLLIRRRRSSH